MIDFARASGVEIWTGANHLELGPGDERSLFNSAFRVDTKGVVHPRYDKNILIPFGEYVPLRDVIPGFDRIKVPGAFAAGEGLPLYDAGPARFVFLICYEAMFPDQVIDRGPRPQWLLNITNDAWFGDSSGPYQHFAMARVRAVEQGLALVRSANTGISAVVDPYGRLLGRLRLNQVGVLDSPLPRPAKRVTLYARYGDGLGLFLIVILAFSSLILRRFLT